MRPPSNTRLVSKGTEIVVLPSGKLDAQETWDAIAGDRLCATLVCDFCLGVTDRVWFWPNRGFSIRNGGFARPRRPRVVERWTFSATGWAACVFCHQLFAARDVDTLVARVSTLNPELSAGDLARTYTALLDALSGQPIAWEAGQHLPEWRMLNDQAMAEELLRS